MVGDVARWLQRGGRRESLRARGKLLTYLLQVNRVSSSNTGLGFRVLGLGFRV